MAKASDKNPPILPQAVEQLDAAVASEVQPFYGTTLVQTLEIASKVGDQPPIWVLCGATIGAGAIAAQPRLTRAGLRMIVAHTLATASKNFLKRRINRTRPNARRPSDDFKARLSQSASHDKTSFPSGHSAGVIAVGAAFAREFPEHRRATLLSTSAIALANVPRGTHYLSDVVVGSAIGLAAEVALDQLIRVLSRR